MFNVRNNKSSIMRHDIFASWLILAKLEAVARPVQLQAGLGIGARPRAASPAVVVCLTRASHLAKMDTPREHQIACATSSTTDPWDGPSPPHRTYKSSNMHLRLDGRASTRAVRGISNRTPPWL